MKITIQNFLFGLLIFFAITGCTVLIITLIIYYRYSHILWFKDIDKDYFGVLGEFIGGVVGTLFSIITTILVYITYNSQQKDVIENKRLLQKQIDLSIKLMFFLLIRYSMVFQELQILENVMH
jgi:hypothetical protein